MLSSYLPAEIENHVADYWKKHAVISKTLQPRREKQLFSFLDGPPTVNAPPGLHHLEVRTFKDMICRFRYMQGYDVLRKSGWDCHGLPVEVQIEKKLGLKNKKAILEYGAQEFTQACREDALRFIDEWKQITEKHAFWVDVTHPYVTMNHEYIESVWWSLKELHKKKAAIQKP